MREPTTYATPVSCPIFAKWVSRTVKTDRRDVAKMSYELGSVTVKDRNKKEKPLQRRRGFVNGKLVDLIKESGNEQSYTKEKLIDQDKDKKCREAEYLGGARSAQDLVQNSRSTIKGCEAKPVLNRALIRKQIPNKKKDMENVSEIRFTNRQNQTFYAYDGQRRHSNSYG